MTKTKSEEVEALNSEREYLRGFRDGQELERKVTKADWLRSEIEKLEGVKTNYVQGMENGLLHHREPCQCQTCVDERNVTLTTIITRYKEELLELKNGK